MDPDGRRKGSTDPYGNRDGRGAPGSGLGGRGGDGAGGVGLPEGKAKLNIIKAKELIKADMIGKSDPYVVLKYGRQQDKTKVINNTQEPKWDHQTEFVVPDGNSRTFHLEVFDSDRIGKDKSLGKLDLDLADVLGMDGQEGRWFPLSGVKSGQILLAADFDDNLGRNAGDVLKDLLSGDNADPSGMLGGRKGSGDLLRGGRGDSQDPDGRWGDSTDPYGSRKGSVDPLGGKGDQMDPDGRRKGSTDPYGNRDGRGAPGSEVGGRGGGGVGGSGLPEGKAKLKVIKAKELIKSDMIGKSDPYVVLKYGRQQDKTKVIKNTQEPKWDHQTEFVVPDGNSRTFHLEVFDSDKIGK